MTLRALAALLALGVAFAARADETAPPLCGGHDLAAGLDLSAARLKRADDLLNAEGLLWRIERDGLAPSYLFGTVHTTDDSAVAIARQAEDFIAGAKVVATELGGPFDAAGQADLAAAALKRALAGDEDTFAPALVGEATAPVEAYLARRGLPKEMAHHLKLWFLAAFTALPNCEALRTQAGLPEVDQSIAEVGKAHGLPVVALESVTDQLDALAATPPGLAATLLAASARAPELDDDAFATLLRLYREKHPAEMLVITDVMPGLTPEERDAEDQFDRLLLVGRNDAMSARAAPLLAAGGAFIAVGALHLAGRGGLIERFRAAGYRVTNVW
jgi:uncharacterized protein